MAKNAIVINRGDTFEFDLTISDDTQESGRYILKNDDVLYFGLMDPHQTFENALVKKRYTKDDADEAGNLTIRLEASDTLDLFPGVYYYAVKLHKLADTEDEFIDDVLTIINRTKFIICE